MIQKKGRKFEHKFSWAIGELAILAQLAQKPEGTHPYDLSKKMEKFVFPQRKAQIEKHQDLSDFIEDLLAFFEKRKTDPTNIRVSKKDLLERAENFPLFCSNQHMNLLLKSISKEPSNNQLEYLREINREIKDSLSFQEQRISIWDDVTRIYPVLRELEKLGMVKVKETTQKSGRLRKIYVITPSGMVYGQKLISTIIEILAFTLPYSKDFSQRSPEMMRLRNQIYPSKGLFRKFLTNADFNNLDIKSLMNSDELFVPILGRPLGLNEPLIITAIVTEPTLFNQIFNRTLSINEKKIIASIIRLQIQDLQESLKQTLRKLDAL